MAALAKLAACESTKKKRGKPLVSNAPPDAPPTTTTDTMCSCTMMKRATACAPFGAQLQAFKTTSSEAVI